jgi:hypothetical protein
MNALIWEYSTPTFPIIQISNYTSISLSIIFIQNKIIKYNTFQSCRTVQDLDGRVSST